MSHPAVVIRALTEPRQLEECVRVQEEVWGFDSSDLIGADMLATAVRHAGTLLGAFLEGQGLVGFVFGFPSPGLGGAGEHSHMLAVRPAFRDRGIGWALKQAQHRRAAERGLCVITWTFDPLEAKNAYFNLNKLKVLARRYYVDLYGETTTSPLHQGLGTDRLLAEWPVEAPPVWEKLPSLKQLPSPLDLPLALAGQPQPSGSTVPGEPDLGLTAHRLALEIPARIQELKETDLALARLWRERTRAALQHYLARHFEIRRLLVLHSKGAAAMRAFYLLEKGPSRSGGRPRHP